MYVFTLETYIDIKILEGYARARNLLSKRGNKSVRLARTRLLQVRWNLHHTEYQHISGAVNN